MISPHGGTLINLELSGEEKELAIKKSLELKRIPLGLREQTDLLLLANGAYSPLTGFMVREDYEYVLYHMRLKNGLLWSLPITLPVDRDMANELKEGEEIALVNERNEPIGILFLTDKYMYDKMREAELVYQTTDPKHPGVKKLLAQKDILLGGEIRLLHRPNSLFPSYDYDPAKLRSIFSAKGWKTIVAFQTRNPIHRAHEYIQKCGLEIVDALLIHPLVGETKADDIPAEVRMKSYEMILRNYYPLNRTMLAVFPASMRYAGPREAVFHTICRKNYGCTHIIIGRDHAGVGSYYGTYDAQKLLLSIPSDELGIVPLCFENSFYCKACGNMASSKTCPHGDEDRVILSGTKVREILRSGLQLPPEFSRPEVAEVLRNAFKQS